MNRLVIVTALVSVFLVVAIFKSNKETSAGSKIPQLKISDAGVVSGPLEEAIRNSRSVQDEIKTIESLLTEQDKCWNDHDIEGFMETYWKSNELTFSGGGKTTRGWQATLDRYKTNYPPEKMGKLHFDGLETTLLNEDVALVLGNWHLDINDEKKTGNFSLVMKKLEGEWKIVHDHSSTLEVEKGWLSEAQALAVGRLALGQPAATGVLEGEFLHVTSGESEQKQEVWVNRVSAEVTKDKP